MELDLDPSAIVRAEVVHLIPITLGQPSRSPFLRAVLGNRKTWLETPSGDDCVLVLPPRAKSTAWQWWCDDSALNVGVDAWRNATMQYNTRKAVSGNQLFQVANQIATIEPAESFFGAPCACGFLFLYGLLTNTIKSKVRGNDDRVTVAQILWHFYDGAHDRGLWTSIISLMLANPVRP